RCLSAALSLRRRGERDEKGEKHGCSSHLEPPRCQDIATLLCLAPAPKRAERFDAFSRGLDGARGGIDRSRGRAPWLCDREPIQCIGLDSPLAGPVRPCGTRLCPRAARRSAPASYSLRRRTSRRHPFPCPRGYALPHDGKPEPGLRLRKAFG